MKTLKKLRTLLVILVLILLMTNCEKESTNCAYCIVTTRCISPMNTTKTMNKVCDTYVWLNNRVMLDTIIDNKHYIISTICISEEDYIESL